MAALEGGSGPGSISLSSDQTFDTVCFICSQSGLQVQFCVQCNSYMCAGCVRDHNKWPLMRSHKLINKKDVSVPVLPPPTETCAEHHGRILDTYCGAHEAVCCGVCISINHK